MRKMLSALLFALSGTAGVVQKPAAGGEYLQQDGRRWTNCVLLFQPNYYKFIN